MDLFYTNLNTQSLINSNASAFQNDLEIQWNFFTSVKMGPLRGGPFQGVSVMASASGDLLKTQSAMSRLRKMELMKTKSANASPTSEMRTNARVAQFLEAQF